MLLRRALIKQAEALAKDDDGDSIQEVRRLREEWKNSGRISREKSIELNQTFNEACDMASEKSFLNRSARAKNSDFDNKPEHEQLSIKIELLENLMQRDEGDLDAHRDNIGNMASPLEARQAEGKLRLLTRQGASQKGTATVAQKRTGVLVTEVLVHCYLNDRRTTINNNARNRELLVRNLFCDVTVKNYFILV